MVIIPKKNGIKTIATFVFFALFVDILFFGGGDRIMNAIGCRLNAPTRARFEELLEEKYGEEFICLKTYSSGGGTGFTPVIDHAVCVPAKDETLEFEAEKYPDDDSLLRDNYSQHIAERQMEELMLPKISDMWGEFGMDCDLYLGWALYDNETVNNKIREGELDWQFFFDEYIKHMSKDDDGDDTINLTFTVCVDDSTRNLSYKEEWEGFHNAAEKLSASEFRDYNVKINYALFFSPRDLYDKCEKIIANHYYTGGMEGWDSLEHELNWVQGGHKWVPHDIHIDTSHQAQNSASLKYLYWFDTVEDYSEYRSKMET